NYLVLDSQDRDRLRAELTRLGLSFSDRPPFRVSLDGLTPQEIIKRIDTPLTTLQTHLPTLEDAYLAIIEGNEDERN
ncbi:MAG TPA: hypothetical protein VHP11_01000, partial [Tepidisphaeraceae bacterium]|nr:hypothetical protein [Tepidisphaeraceae bacterium]